MVLGFCRKKHHTPFTNKIYKAVVLSRSSFNIVISPYGIKNVFLMIYLGTEGKARQVLTKPLNLHGDRFRELPILLNKRLELVQSEIVDLYVENRVFTDFAYELRDEYKKKLKQYFNTDCVGINFGNRRLGTARINKWAAEKTNNQIIRIADRSTFLTETACAILSASAFIGQWRNKFPVAETKKMRFFLSKSESILVDMMSQKARFRIGEFRFLKCTGIEMPYENSNVSLIVLVPHKIDGLHFLEKNIQYLDFFRICDHFEFNSVHLFFPKFELFYEMSLRPVLQEMGAHYIFNPNADFSKMLKSSRPGKDFEITELRQRVCFKATEYGTENPVVNSVNPLPPIETYGEIIVNRPFLFVLKDKNHIYQCGRIINLEAEECDLGEIGYNPRRPKEKKIVPKDILNPPKDTKIVITEKKKWTFCTCS